MSISPPSKIETAITTTTRIVSDAFVRNTCAPVILDAAQLAGQACLNNPSLIVVGTASVIATKELATCMAPTVKRFASPVVAVTKDYPKTTALTTSYLCSKALPFAVTGEPINVAVAGVTCTVAAASLWAYLTKKDPEA
jgi:hypothetical protein